MVELLPRMKQHFDSLQDRLVCLADLEFNGEGWFKIELLTLFSRLKKEGLLNDVRRETRIQTIDIKTNSGGIEHYIELKHAILQQNRDRYAPSDYVSKKDVHQFEYIEQAARCWILLLVTPKPRAVEWETSIEKIKGKAAPWHVVSRSQPDQFPSTYYLGLLKVCRSG